jgi:hypothetical protein
VNDGIIILVEKFLSTVRRVCRVSKLKVVAEAICEAQHRGKQHSTSRRLRVSIESQMRCLQLLIDVTGLIAAGLGVVGGFAKQQ